MAIFLTVDCNEASMCWNCEEICGKRKEAFLTLFLRNVWGFFQPRCEESMCWNSTGIFLTIFLTFGIWGKRTFTIVRKKVLKFPYIFPHILLLRIFLTIFLTFTFPHIFLTFFLTFGMSGKRTFTIVRKKVLKFPYIFPHILLLRIFLTIFLTFTFPHIFLTFFLTFGMSGKRTFTIVRKKVLKFPYIFPHILLLRIFLTIFLTFTFPHIFLTFFLTFGMSGKRTFTTVLMWGKCQENVWKMSGNCEEFSWYFPDIFLTLKFHSDNKASSLKGRKDAANRKQVMQDVAWHFAQTPYDLPVAAKETSRWPTCKTRRGQVRMPNAVLSVGIQ